MTTINLQIHALMLGICCLISPTCVQFSCLAFFLSWLWLCTLNPLSTIFQPYLGGEVLLVDENKICAEKNVRHSTMELSTADERHLLHRQQSNYHTIMVSTSGFIRGLNYQNDYSKYSNI